MDHSTHSQWGRNRWTFARVSPAAIPDPHVHHYFRAWDDAERGVLRCFEWHIKPLRPSDVQFDVTRDSQRD